MECVQVDVQGVAHVPAALVVRVVVGVKVLATRVQEDVLVVALEVVKDFVQLVVEIVAMTIVIVDAH